VIAITHLPQVASRAERHFSVVKQADGDPATASVTRLEGDQVVSEIARMMGAEAGDEAATRHARELVAAGRSD
jgi:DNA repair protein RecN (Recombination protein N)